jgi:phasin family protein
MNNNFNFLDSMKDFMNPENFTKHFNSMPAYDLSQFAEGAKRNAEALTEAGKVASESAQAIMRRGSEIAQDNATHLFNSMKEIASAGNPEKATSCQQQFVQNFMQQAVSNTKEMMDMSSKALMEVFEKVSKHTNDNISTCMTSPNKSKKS